MSAMEAPPRAVAVDGVAFEITPGLTPYPEALARMEREVAEIAVPMGTLRFEIVNISFP